MKDFDGAGHPSVDDGCQASGTGWRESCYRRQPPDETAAPGYQSLATTRTQSLSVGSIFEYHRWKANLRILGVEEIKSVPYIPRSHPFVERLIGTIRREFLDHTLFWNARNLERKLADFQIYYNEHRTHSSLSSETPSEVAERTPKIQATLNSYRWQSHCRGLYQLPAAA